MPINSKPSGKYPLKGEHIEIILKMSRKRIEFNEWLKIVRAFTQPRHDRLLKP